METISHNCEKCDKDVKELYAYEVYKMGYAVFFLCAKCYKQEHGVKFEDHNREDFEKERAVLSE